MYQLHLPEDQRDKLLDTVLEEPWGDGPWYRTADRLGDAGRRFVPAAALAAIGSLLDDARARSFVLTGLIAPETADEVAEGALIALMEAAGQQVFTYAEQNHGEVVHRVEPKVGLENQRGNSGRGELTFHSDDAIVPREFRAEVLALLALENECACATYFVPTYELVRQLTAADVKVLSAPRFRVPSPDSFSVFAGQIIYSEPRPLLHLRGREEPEIACALYNAVPVFGDDEAVDALTALREAIDRSNPERIVLNRGDVLVFSNVHGVHARDAVTGSRRLRRVYGRRSLSHLRRATGLTADSCVFPVANLLLLGQG